MRIGADRIDFWQVSLLGVLSEATLCLLCMVIQHTTNGNFIQTPRFSVHFFSLLCGALEKLA